MRNGEGNAHVDVTIPRNRRRFYLDRGMRKKPIGAGSDLNALMALPRRSIDTNVGEILGDIPWAVVGGVATRAYMPERATQDIDVLADHERFTEAADRLTKGGWKRKSDLVFPNASLGLYGTAWKGTNQLGLLTSDQAWAREALSIEAYDQSGIRIVSLPYLALMKLDSARAIDQGDLSRMLGRLDEKHLLEVIAVVEQHAREAAADVRQYAQLGRWELEQPTREHEIETEGKREDDPRI